MDKDNLPDKLASAKETEITGNFFSAAFLYRDALELAVKLQDSKSIKLCKNKIVEMNKKSIASGKDFKEVEFTHQFSEKNQEALKNIIEKILGLENIDIILKVIGEHPYFFPKAKEVENLADKTIPLAHQLATLSTISDQGHSVRGSSLGKYSWFMHMYDLNQQLIMDMYLDRIMYMLINNDKAKNKLTFKKLSSYFSKSKVIDPKKLEIILVGLERYFKKDYISAMHILIPQFEAVLLDIAQRCGIDIVALDPKMDTATRTRVLSEHHLESSEFINLFGEDFCRQVKFILFEPLGYKLRHKIAHGEINPKECNFRNTNLIIYLFLVLLARVEIKNKKE